MARRRRKPSFSRSKSLPVDFTRDYVIALRALSRKHKDEPEALKAMKLLKRMSREASLAGRGEVWMPRPGSTTGHYPVIENLPFNKIRTAVRKNTLKRQRAWDAVAAATRPFYPQHSAVSQVERSLLPAIITSLPFVRGRTPALLGKRVPGELQMTKRGSVIPIGSISPEEWAQHGFQPLKFEQYGWRERWKARAEANRKKADKQVRTAWGWERRLLGKENLTLAQARIKAKRLSAPGTKITVAKGARPWFRIKKGRGEINVPPHAAAIAHEAVHTRQHKKLGRGFFPLYKGPAVAGVAGGIALAALRGAKVGRFRRLSRWAAPAVAAAGHVPQLAMEAGAIKGSIKERGGKRGAAFTAGSYLTGAAAMSAVSAGYGTAIGRSVRKAKLKSTLARRALRTIGRRRRGFSLDSTEVLIYEKGYQYGLRAFLRRHRVGERIKRGALPAALGGIVAEGLRRAHTEIGIPATTVDLVPIQRTTIRGEYAPYTNVQLGAFRRALEAKISEVDEFTAGEMRKQVGKIDIEIIGRRAV